MRASVEEEEEETWKAIVGGEGCCKSAVSGEAEQAVCDEQRARVLEGLGGS